MSGISWCHVDPAQVASDCTLEYQRQGELTPASITALQDCTAIRGNLTLNGTSSEQMFQLAFAFRRIRRISGHVVVENMVADSFPLLQFVRTVDGDITLTNNTYLKEAFIGVLNVKGRILIFRSPHICLVFDRIRPYLQRLIQSDCSFYDEHTFKGFEHYAADIDRMSLLGMVVTILFFVCLMMNRVFRRLCESMNISRWRKMTELDERLRTDSRAYLDEESSEEELDIVTWKRRQMMNSRLDGRDLEGEQIREERKQYREMRKEVRLIDKMMAITREFDDSDEDSSPSWLRSKRNTRRKDTSGEEEDREDIFWMPPARLRQVPAQELQQKEDDFEMEFKSVVRDVMSLSNKRDTKRIDNILKYMQDTGRSWKNTDSVLDRQTKLKETYESRQNEKIEEFFKHLETVKEHRKKQLEEIDVTRRDKKNNKDETVSESFTVEDSQGTDSQGTESQGTDTTGTDTTGTESQSSEGRIKGGKEDPMFVKVAKANKWRPSVEEK
uniref:Recep_L_domain domain-containing protein n=2 Tax=Caenorhabditis japonica TaxID=281687 RepID=A0A8R1HM70_CAEJA